MNTRTHAKIEASLQCAIGGNPYTLAESFKENVFKTTGIQGDEFDSMGLTADTYRRLHAGDDREQIRDELF